MFALLRKELLSQFFYCNISELLFFFHFAWTLFGAGDSTFLLDQQPCPDRGNTKVEQSLGEWHCVHPLLLLTITIGIPN